MARYYLNLFNALEVTDEEGHEFGDLAHAKNAAIMGARSVMAEHVMEGRPLKLSDRIEVADECGHVLAVIPFREIVTIIDR